jgi:hypothetical protein
MPDLRQITLIFIFSEEAKSEVDIVVTSDESEYPGMKKCTSDIYMLAYNSPILFFMKSAWDNFRIVSTSDQGLFQNI